MYTGLKTVPLCFIITIKKLNMKTLKSTLLLFTAALSLFVMSCGQGTQEEKPAGDSATSQTTTTPDEAKASLSLSVEGMTCENCTKALTEAVSTLAGVLSCNVSFENKTATVEFDNTKTTEDAIMAQVTTAHNGKFKATKVSEPMAALATTECGANCTKPCCKGKEGEAKKCDKESKDCCKKDAAKTTTETTTKESTTKESTGCCKKDAKTCDHKEGEKH